MIRQLLIKTKYFFSKRQIRPLVAFFLINLFFIELKTVIEYFISFNLGITGTMQLLIALLNPLPTAIILLSLALYFRGYLAYWIMIVMNFIQTIWLFANMLYYREFSDFLSLSIMSSGSSVGENLSKSIAGIVHLSDFLVFLDILVLILLLLFRQITSDKKGLRRRFAVLTSTLGLVLVFLVFGLASANRSGLLTRSFDNNYIVKYLGLNEYAAFNAVQTHNQAVSRDKANASELKPIAKWIQKHRAPVNVKYFGIDKGRNVIVFHLESFQQFLIDYRVNGREVTPNLNKFFHDQHTLSFDNFYNQVGQGKTSDAETMLDNSLFGLPSGSAMVKYGTSNVFQAAPAILNQMGYTTAAFHGDVPTFWNRNNTYKSWGYNYFFSKQFYPQSTKSQNNVGYGMLDKIFLRDSARYIQQLPQPFYAKIITVTNHYPYETNKEIASQFPATTTGDRTVDHYVQTAHYLDSAFGEFMNWMKATGLYNNSLIYVYGDHYGISENHQPAIGQLLQKDRITNYDLAQFQKVPFMIHANNLAGGINHTYGGEIDVLPTLFDLLGVPNDGTIQFGDDLLSDQNRQIVSFRNGDFVTPTIIKMNGSYWQTDNGRAISYKNASKKTKRFIDQTQNFVDQQLAYSDQVVSGDLLRFDKRNNFKKVDKKNYDYTLGPSLASLKQAQISNPSSLRTKNGGKSLLKLYKSSEVMLWSPSKIKKYLQRLAAEKTASQGSNADSSSSASVQPASSSSSSSAPTK
ncbi:LTA synthase family protein [Oenococcus kitaharae]|uniref:Lipoteichoic acid synthase LtaS Type IIa n=1 Tax=Oenococcus kitaharae DSM 17330 TaxID=1045004 RepID=G9WI66_9LACO|nr:LTA synthase family protein [Oenococcus kitaharae]EHN59188.1 Lipoteichoic acid synthase LtaS Type IIa [Oenococcus kitaharae DSM 17330]OEY81937.1 glycerol phosphate lipoteichoic acid synthase [Oenococcus kitaharae]OEY82308.1 glycerol phosphate lipoteichoic acid synthase [Oenococcus kitaharae]OEY82714.1 glycerol phosphate lipoteichoic acid synthase [Oenococcus kitaharae]